MAKKPETANVDVELQAYTKNLHRIGTTCMMALLVLTFLPALYVFIVLGEFPGWGALAGTIAALAGQEVATWIMEPVMYFPMIGVAGSYICFTAGNITNMRIPCALAAQAAVGATTGTAKGDAASVFGMVGSVVVNFIALGIVILFGNWLLSILPEGVKVAFNYAMPAVFGSLIAVIFNMFGGSKKEAPAEETKEEVNETVNEEA